MLRLNDQEQIEDIAGTLENPLDVRVLRDQVVLAEDAVEFIQGDLGQYLLARAREEAADAYKALFECRPNDEESILKEQNRIAVCEMFRTWLIEAINTGRMALSELNRRDEDGET